MSRSRLIAFVSAKEDASSLALCRIIVGVGIFCHVTRFLASGVAKITLTHHSYGGLSGWHGWLEHIGGATPAHVTGLCIIVIASALLVAIGLFTRPALFVLWFAFRVFSETNPVARGSHDALLVNALFLLMLSGCGRALSIDALLFKKAREVHRWPRIMLVFQLTVLYVGSAAVKWSTSWVVGGDSSALWYILHQAGWVRFHPDLLPLWSFPLTQLGTAVAWLFEAMAPAFFLAVILREGNPTTAVNRALKRVLDAIRFREVYLITGLLMHVGIEAFMEVACFLAASLAYYPSAFRPSDWAALRARFGSARRAAGGTS